MAPATTKQNVSSDSEFSHKHAKNVAARGFDYTLLMVLLVLQYARCIPPSLDEFVEEISNQTLVGSLKRAVDIYTCHEVFSTDETREHVLEILRNPGILTGGIFFFLYGALCPIFVWLHSYLKFKKLGEARRTNVEKTFQWTDWIFIIDSFIEIPVCFFNAPKTTMTFWTLYGGFVVGLYFAAVDFASKFDQSASAVFYVNCGIAAISMLQFTGQLCQYSAIYYAAKRDGVEKEEKHEERALRKKEQVTNEEEVA